MKALMVREVFLEAVKAWMRGTLHGGLKPVFRWMAGLNRG